MAAEFYRRREARPPGRRRIFGAHATHLRAQRLRCSLTQFSNALAPLLAASPESGPPGSPNLSPRSRDVIARIVVVPKPVVNDPQGVTVRQGLALLGFGEVTEVRVGKVIHVRLDATSERAARERVDAMCSRLLANHVIEDYHFELEHESKGAMR